jgi:protein N-terminal methyltransferase
VELTYPLDTTTFTILSCDKRNHCFVIMEDCATVTELDSIQLPVPTSTTESSSFSSSLSSSPTNNTVVIRTFVLKLRNTRVHLCSWGASILNFFILEEDDDEEDDDETTGRDKIIDIVCGYKSAKDMNESQNPFYFHGTVGRVANRIANGGTFTLQGKQYQIPINNQPFCALHGGTVGWSHQNWNALVVQSGNNNDSTNKNAVQFTLLSQDGDQGFPGTVQATVSYSLRPSLSSTGVILQLQMEAILLEDHQSTPINLAHHSYFNLMGSNHHDKEGILDHTLKLEADAYTSVDQNGIPTHRVLSLDQDIVMDFRQPKILRNALHDYGIQKMGLSPEQSQINIMERHKKLLCHPYGFDHNYIVRNQLGMSLPRVASLSCRSKTLTIYSDAPGVQCYTANYLGVKDDNDNDHDGNTTGNLKAPYQRWDAICLETQHFPNSICDDSSSCGDDYSSLFYKGKCPILTPAHPKYHQIVVYQLETASGWQQAYQGSNTNGKEYPSIEAMWEDQDLSTWYKRAKGWYEDNCDATVDGVLGGIGHISDLDLDGSKEFVNRLNIPSSSDNNSLRWACDVGAGIGRITKGILLNIADRCDLIESSSRLLMAAPDYIGSQSSQCRFFCHELQDWQPTLNQYSIIWIQWVLCYLTDKDIVNFLRRCSDSLIQDGWIVLKENTCNDEAFVLDMEDASVTRSLSYWLDLIAKSGLQVRHIQWQDNFPDDIFPVPMLALQL